MGIFFKKVERKESVKSVAIIKKIILALLIIFFVVGIVSGSISSYFKVMMGLLGVLSLIDGVESYVHKDVEKTYRIDFGFAALYLLLAVII